MAVDGFDGGDGDGNGGKISCRATKTDNNNTFAFPVSGFLNTFGF